MERIDSIMLSALNVLAVELQKQVERSGDDESVHQSLIRIRELIEFLNRVRSPDIDTKKTFS